MIMTQEQAFLKAQQQLQVMEAFVEQAAIDERRIDQVERELFSRLLAVGLTLLGGLRGRPRRRRRGRPARNRRTATRFAG